MSSIASRCLRLSSSPGRVVSNLVLLSALLVTAGSAHAGTIVVPSGGGLQAALDAAQPGDTIVLEAGASYVGSFTLPVKSGAEYITIQSSRAGELAEGVRVSPSQAGLFAKIQTSSVAAAIIAGVGAHHYKFIGIEFSTADPGIYSYGVVMFGDGDSAGPQNALAAVPHHLIIDRCYVHGLPGQNVQRGVSLNSAETSILNSYISEIHWTGADTQAAGGWNGPGPFHIINNYLEAAGENVMFGGALPAIANLVPSDIEIRRNYISKPLRWKAGEASYDGSNWTVKNLLELKSARRVVIDGNVFENNWAQAQVGWAVIFNTLEDSGPQAVVEDVQFTNNIVRHSGNGINLRGMDVDPTVHRMRRITIKNNLFDDINSQRWGGGGIFVQLLRGTIDVTVDHNTANQTGQILMLDGETHQNLVFTNNIARHNAYGVFGNGGFVGTAGLNQYSKKFVFEGNLIIDLPPDVSESQYPGRNSFVTDGAKTVFSNWKTGNYRIVKGSRFQMRSIDGKEVGCDFDALERATDWFKNSDAIGIDVK